MHITPATAAALPALRQLLNMQLPQLRVHTHIRITMVSAITLDPVVSAERMMLGTALAKNAPAAVFDWVQNKLRKNSAERNQVLQELMQTVGTWIDRMDRPGDRMPDEEVIPYVSYLHEGVKAAAELDGSFIPWFLWLNMVTAGIIPEHPPAAMPNGVPGLIQFPRKGDAQPGAPE